MTTNELQSIVTIEAVVLALVMIIIVAAIRRWKLILGVTSAIATVALFFAWAPMMALGALLTYGPASILLCYELDKKTDKANDSKRHMMRTTCWSLLALGVVLLIMKNIYNIFSHLN